MATPAPGGNCGINARRGPTGAMQGVYPAGIRERNGIRSAQHS